MAPIVYVMLLAFYFLCFLVLTLTVCCRDQVIFFFQHLRGYTMYNVSALPTH